MTTQHNDHLTTEQISAFIDKQLSPQEQAAWNAHLQTCPDCQQRVAAMRQTVALLHALPQPEMPRSFILPTNVTYLQERPQQQSQQSYQAPTATNTSVRRRSSYVRNSFRVISTLAAVAGLIFILSSFSLASFRGSSASNTGTTSSGQSPFTGTSKTPNVVVPRTGQPNNCEHNSSPPATCNASGGTVSPSPSPPAISSPTPTTPTGKNNGTGESPGTAGIDLTTPQGHLELGSVLLLFGIFGFVLTRRKRSS